MEKRAPDPIIILKVDTNCCDDCSGKLQKALLEINGVNQAIVDPQKKSVSIRGNANSCMLIEEIARMGKRAELMFYDKEPKVEGRHQKNVRFAQEKHPSTDDHHKENVRQDDGHKHFCCDDDDGGGIHKDIGEENMPSWGSKNIFGSHSDYPRQTHFCRPESSRHDTRNPNYSRWFREEPPLYEHPRWGMPPPPPPPSSYFYGPFRGRRPMSQFDHFPH